MNPQHWQEEQAIDELLERGEYRTRDQGSGGPMLFIVAFFLIIGFLCYKSNKEPERKYDK